MMFTYKSKRTKIIVLVLCFLGLLLLAAIDSRAQCGPPGIIGAEKEDLLRDKWGKVVEAEEKLKALLKSNSKLELKAYDTVIKYRLTSLEILFDYNSAVVKPTYARTLKFIADLLNRLDVVAIIVGHADERGSEVYNIDLGYARANAVGQALRSFGLKNHTFVYSSAGEFEPADPGHNEEAWRKNRRVTFQLFR